MTLDSKLLLFGLLMALPSAFVAYWKGFTRGRQEGFGLTGYWRERASHAEQRVRLLDSQLQMIQHRARQIGLTEEEIVAFDQLQRRFNQ
jgi:hypothetical protein